MYSTPHTTTAAGIIVGLGDNFMVSIPLAIISHFFVDFIDEKGLSKDDRFSFDIVPQILISGLALVSGSFWLWLVASMTGNLFDLIDKKLYLSIFYPSKYKSTKFFHFQKQIIHPKPFQTKVIHTAAVILTGFLILSERGIEISKQLINLI